MTPSRRAGTALAELILATMIVGVAAGIGAAILVAAERRTRADASSDRAVQSVRDVTRLLVGDLEAALPESVVVRGDTAIDLYAHVGASVACVAAGTVLVVPGASVVTGVPLTFWRQWPEAGDLAIVWDSAGGGRWDQALIDSVSAPADGGGCATTSGFRSAADSVARLAVARVRLDRALSPGVIAGAPLRIFRGGRWLLHRGSDRSWSLAYRRCARSVCSAAQPVAGPLAAAADTGLAVHVSSSGRIEISVRAAGARIGRRFIVVVRGALSALP